MEESITYKRLFDLQFSGREISEISREGIVNHA